MRPLDHATNVGRLFRPEQPLLPNYKWVPIGYHGRASSIVISGTEILRPRGQIKLTGKDDPEFRATAQLDYEIEVGAYMGGSNALGEPIPINGIETGVFSAECYVFGSLCSTTGPQGIFSRGSINRSGPF